MDLRLAVISVLVATTLSGPVKNLNSNSKCATQCTSKDKFGYRVGSIYEYSYEAETKTGIQGATEDHGGLKVTAEAEIEVLSKCEFLLTVKNSNIYGSDPDYPRQFKPHPKRNEFQRQFEEHSLRFSFQDGVVEELCPDDQESEWTLNFKRGILSAFQNSMDSLDMDTEVIETDVTGRCPTTYRIKQEGWKTIKVKKTKDLVTCSNRHGFQTSAQSTIYNVPSSVQSLPLLKSTQDCDQEISTEGRIDKTVCHEIHLFRPFSKGSNGAMTEVIQKLTFVTTKAGGRLMSDPITKRTSLLFHHHEPETTPSARKDVAIAKLTELCTTTKDRIKATTPKLFSELVYALKQLSSSDLADVYQQSQLDSFCKDNSERLKKFYTDAVPMIGTTAAVEQIAKLILNNEITGRMAEIWLSSLSLVQNPSKEMLRQISKLMDLPEGTKVYLPASVMVNTYCKENEACESETEVQDIINKLKTALGTGCIITDINYLEVITSLRAIGNIEQSSKLVPSVLNCIRKKDNDMEIRVAAVQAYRRMDCSVDRSPLMEIYKDTAEDSELRISAYIQVMKCPSEAIISEIKDTLAKEEVNQVGSFVWTHLTNLMETSLVYKQLIQVILEDETLKKEFDLDKRKFSRNYEWSYFSESMNAGAGVESNIIFSQQSFIPRSAMVNLTVDLFGHSVNLFELGGRMEGLEKLLIENMGPKHDYEPEQKQNRDIDFNKIERIEQKLSKPESDFKGAVFVRMFGNEITYYNTKQSADNQVEQKPFNFLNMFMNLAKEQKFSQKMSQMLLDSSIITPTVAGMPLHLKVTATSSVDMNASGKMDLRSPSKSIVMEGSLSPSGAVAVMSQMSVDAFITRSGLKMESTFHTSTAVSAKFELDKKQELTMQFSLPQEKSEIIEAKSQFFIEHAGQEREQQMITKNRITKQSCSGATIARITGVEFCLDMSLPGKVENTEAPHFPLTGPARYGVVVFKRDTHTSYKFDFKFINDKRKTHFMTMYDTPGSKIERKTGFNIEVNHQENKMDISLTSPWKKANFEGTFDGKGKKKQTATGTITVDAKQLYKAEGSLYSSESKSQSVYKPKLEIIRHDGDPIVLAGNIVYKPGKVMTSELVLTGAMDKPASLDLSVRFTKSQYGFTGTFLYNKDQKYRADMNFDINDKGKKTIYSPRIIVATPEKELVNFYGSVVFATTKGKSVKYDFILDKLTSSTIKLKGDSTVLSKGKRKTYKGKLFFQGPKKILTRVRYTLDQKLRVTSSAIKVDYNLQKVFKTLKDTIIFNTKLLKKTQKNLQRVAFTSDLKSARFADYNNDVTIKVDNRPNSKVDADFIVNYGKTYKFKTNKYRLSVLSSTKYNFNKKKNSGIVNYNVTFQLPAEKLDSYFSGTHKYTKTELKSDLHIRYDNKKSADVSLSLNDLSKKFFKYDGDFALKYMGNHIQLSGLAVEKSKEYSSKLSVKHAVGKTSTFQLAYGWPKDSEREFDSTLQIYSLEPVSISSSVILNKMKPEGTVKVKVGKDFYVVSGLGEYDGEMYLKGLGKVAYPARQIIVETEGGIKNSIYSGKVDVNWDARDKKSDSRVFVEGSLRNNTIEDFSVSTKLEFPGRDLSASINHYSKDKIDTSVSFGWEKQKAVGLAVKFDKDIRKYKSHVEGSLGITTPWKEMMEFEIGGNHAQNKEKMGFGGTLTWNKGSTAAFQYETKLPMDHKDVQMKLELKTPIKALKNPTVSFRNTMSNDMIKQEGNLRLTWGNGEFVDIETNGETLSVEKRRNLQRNVGVLTSFEGYKVITLNWTHTDDMNKFLSKATYIKDGVKFLYILDMVHDLNEWSMTNDGKFDISSPSDSIKITWSHRNTESVLDTTLNALWSNGHRFNTKVKGSIENVPNRKYSFSVDMKTPSTKLSSFNIDLVHEDKTGYLKSMGRIVANRENIGTVNVNYQRQLGSTDYGIRVSSKYMRDFVIEGQTRHAHLPMTGNIKVEWDTMKKIILEGSVNYDKMGTLDSKLELTTPFRQVPRVIFIATHKLVGLDWIAVAELEYAPMQKVKAELLYNNDITGIERLARFQIFTPFPQFSKLNAGTYFKFNQYPTQWENKIDLEIVPLLKKITAETKWRHDTETKASFRIDTPFEKLPYMTTEWESKTKIDGKRYSKMMLEYLPTQIIEVSSNYKLNDNNDIDGSISIKTPFNEEVFAKYSQAGYEHEQMKGYQRRAELKYARTQNIVIDTTFGVKPKIFGILKVQVPVRGYETVILSFGHKGTTWKDFHSNLEYDTNGKKIELEALFDIVGDKKGLAKITTPFESLKVAEFGYNFDSTYTEEGNISGMKSRSGVVFNDFKTEANADFSHNDLQTTGSFSFRSPIKGAEDLMLSFNKDGNLQKLTFNGEAGYETGSKYIVAVKHSLEGKDAATDVVIQNPLTEDIIVKVSYDNRKKGFTTIVKGSVGTENSITAETTYKLKKFDLDLEVDLTTVITGEKHNHKFEFEHKGKLTDFRCNAKFQTSMANVKDNLKISFKGSGSLDDIDAKLELTETLKDITVDSGLKTYKKDEKYMADAHYNGNTVTSEILIEDTKRSGKVVAQTKVEGYESMEVDIDSVGELHSAKNTMTVKISKNKPIILTADLKFKGITSFGGDVKLTSGFEGFTNEEISLDHSGNIRDFTSSVIIKKSDMDEIRLNGNLNSLDLTKITGTATFTSGIKGYERIIGNFKHNGDATRFNCEASMTIPNRKPAKITLEYNNLLNKLDGRAEFTSDFAGADNIVASFKHSTSKTDVESEAELILPNRAPAKLKFEFSNGLPTSYKGKVTFTSDLEGARDVEFSIDQVNRQHEFKQKVVINSINMKPLSQEIRYKNTGNSFEAVYDLKSKELYDIELSMVHEGDIDDFTNTIVVSIPTYTPRKSVVTWKKNDDYSNINGQIKLETGIEGAENVFLTLTHKGQPTDFSCKLVVQPPFMDKMELTSEFKLEKMKSMDVIVDFTSAIKGGENLGFSTAAKITDKSKNAADIQTEIKIDRLRKINMNLKTKVDYGQSDVDRNTDMELKFDMISPFEKVKTLNVEYIATQAMNFDGTEASGKTVTLVTFNGDKYWDTTQTTKMSKEDANVIADFVMEAPKQVEYGYNVQYGNPYSVDVHVNWDKTDSDSNLRIDGQLSNMEDLKLRIIFPRRTTVVEGAYKGELEKSVIAMVTLDEAKDTKYGIETKWQDQRPDLQIMQGSVKVITPFRSVETTGAMNHAMSRKTMEGSVSWDADKDRSKKVAVVTEMTPDSNGYSGKVHLSLTAIGKELTWARQMTEKDGSILYECRNEFSYSTDPSKTIVFTTKLEDVSEFGSKNHTYTVGISQVATKVDMSVMGHLGTSDERDSVGMLINYQTSKLQKKNLLLLGEIDKLQKKLILLTVGPRKSAGIVGQLQGDSPQTVSIRGLFGLKDIVDADMIIDSKKKAVELQMKYDRAHPNSVLHIAAKYPSQTNFETQIYRTGDKPQITDSVIKVNLRTSRILHSKINWRPQALKELMNFGVDSVEHYGKSLNSEFLATANEIEDEVTTKYNAIATELDTELQPYIDSLSQSLRMVQKQLNAIKVNIDKIYANNDMYVKDVTDKIREKSSALMDLYRKAIVEMKKIAVETRKQIESLKDLKNYPFQEKYEKLVNEIAAKITTFKQEMVDTLKAEMDTMTKTMKTMVEEARKDVEKLTNQITKQLTVLLDNVLEKAEVKELMSYIEEVLKSLPDSTNMPEIDWSYYIRKINMAIKDKLEKVDLHKTYNEVLESSKTAVMNQLEPIMQDEKVKELREMADQLQKKIISAYKQWNIEKTIKGYLIELYNDFQTYIKEDIANLKFLHWDKNRIIAFDPENGQIEFEIYLPTPADTLESLPKFKIHKYVRSFNKIIKKIDSLELPRVFDFSIWDIYYKYKPSWNPKDWVPPFDAFALVAGDQHFITFDKRQIDFGGRCSYVLVKDMLYNRFTVIMNYNNKRKPAMESLVVLAEGKSVEIHPDFSVKLDNRPTELPIKHQKLTVIRDGNLIQVNTGRGLIISGNLANKHILFSLNGWYFGNVGGMLGSYNNEQYDDMIDSNGKVTKEVNVMAQTWEVGRRCRNSDNIIPEVKVEEGKKGYQKCSNLFIDTDSTLRPCFKIVDPAYFMKVCMSEMQTSKRDECNAVSAYVRQCRQEGVMLWEPKSCVTCQAPNKENYEGGESIKLAPSSDEYNVPKSADVVLVVEQSKCNSEVGSHLGDLVDKIEQALQKRGIADNRYGLIGFGGTPRKAFGRKSASSTHTFEGSIFSESNNFAKGKETLQYKYHFTDPLEAIMTGADMPFRTGVSKTIILIHCGECKKSDLVNYGHLKSVLSSRGITLHDIRDQDIRLEGNKSPTSMIYGFDNKNNYMYNSKSNDDDDKTDKIHVPEDACASLTLGTDGSIFHARGLTDSKIRNRKWFLNKISQRITGSAAPEECQVCQCVADHTGMAKSICRTCYSSVSDYLPSWWNTLKHPSKINDHFEKEFKDYFGDDAWTVLQP